MGRSTVVEALVEFGVWLADGVPPILEKMSLNWCYELEYLDNLGQRRDIAFSLVEEHIQERQCKWRTKGEMVISW